MEQESKISEIIEKSLSGIRATADADTVVGKPIETSAGTTIIPISKISVGVATGGVDYKGKHTPDKNSFGGGGGTGMQVTPVAFLIVHADGTTEMMNVNNPTERPADIGYNINSLIDHAPDIFAKIKALFGKKEDKADTAEE